MAVVNRAMNREKLSFPTPPAVKATSETNTELLRSLTQQGLHAHYKQFNNLVGSQFLTQKRLLAFFRLTANTGSWRGQCLGGRRADHDAAGINRVAR